MHVNNEIGVVQDIAAIGALCRERGIAFHVDAAQSAGKLPIDVEAMNVDLLSLTAHKIYGPKGIGALYVRRKPPLGLEPLMYGGGQERGLRSGTLATHQIVGMGLAFEIAERERQQDVERIGALRDQLWAGIAQHRRRRAERASRGARRRPAERQLPRRRRREPAVRIARTGGLRGRSVLVGLGRGVLRAAGARSQRPARAELAALQPGSLHDRRGGRDAVAAVKREVTRLRSLSPHADRRSTRQATRSQSHERSAIQSAGHRAFRAAAQRRPLRAAPDVIAASAGDPEQGVRFDLSARVRDGSHRRDALRGLRLPALHRGGLAGSASAWQGATQERAAALELARGRRRAGVPAREARPTARSRGRGARACGGVAAQAACLMDRRMRPMHQFGAPVRSYNLPPVWTHARSE